MQKQMVAPEAKMFKDCYEVFDNIVRGKFDKTLMLRLRMAPHKLGKKKWGKGLQQHYFFYLGYKVTVFSTKETRLLEVHKVISSTLVPIFAGGEGYYGAVRKTCCYDSDLSPNALHMLFEIRQLADDLAQYIK